MFFQFSSVCVRIVRTLNGASHVGCVAFKITSYVFAVRSQVEFYFRSNPGLVPQFVNYTWWQYVKDGAILKYFPKHCEFGTEKIMVWILSAGLKKGVVYWKFCEHFWRSLETCNVGWLGKCEQAVVQSIKATFNNMQYSSVSALPQIYCVLHIEKEAIPQLQFCLVLLIFPYGCPSWQHLVFSPNRVQEENS
jgi:hypothetical protein